MRFLNHSSRFFGLVLWVFAGCGLLLQLTGYNYGLPYVEEYDEGRLFYNAYIMRGVAPGLTPDLPGYSPGIFILHHLIQPVVERFTGRPAELDMGGTIGILRFFSVFANGLSVVLMALCARKLAGDAAGLIAAVAWWTLPDVLYNTVIALTEPWQIVCYMLALYFCLDALQQDRPRSAFFSVLAGLGAVVFKYSAFPVLGLGVGAALWQGGMQPRFRKSAVSNYWRRWLMTLALQFIGIGLAAGWLLLIYGAGGDTAHPETSAFLSGGLSKLTNFTEISTILQKAIQQINLTVPLFFGLLLVGSLVHFRQAVLWQRVGFVFTLGLWLITNVFVVTYLVYWQGLNRYVIAASPMGVILVAVSVAQIGRWMMTMIARKSPGMARWAFVIGLGVFIVGWLLPPLRGSLAIVQERALPDTRAAMAEWSLNVIREDYAVIMTDDREMRVFSRDRGGYRGLWLFSKHANLFEKSLADWQAEAISYVLASGDKLQQALTTTAQGAAYLEELLFLKQFPPMNNTEKWRGPALYFYRIGQMQHESDVVFGETIRLAGYDLTGEMQPGETLVFTPYWQSIQTPTADYNLYLHLRPADDLTQVAAQNDGQPVYNRPSLTWTDPGETLIGEAFSLTIPADIAPGTYLLLTGLYDYQTGIRLMTHNGTDYVTIAEIIVSP